MAERFEVLEVEAGPFPLFNREHTCGLVLVTLLDYQAYEIRECVVEVRLSDGAITRAIAPEVRDTRFAPSEEASAFLEKLSLGAHPIIEAARALAAQEAG